MAINYSDAILNQAAESLRGTNPTITISHIQLHTGDPGVEGTANIASSPSGRAAVSFGVAAGGEVAVASDVEISVDSETITHITFWDALTNGNFCGTIALDTQRVFSGAGTFTVTTGTSLGFENAP